MLSQSRQPTRDLRMVVKSLRTVQHSVPAVQAMVLGKDQTPAEVTHTHLKTVKDLPGPYGPPGAGWLYRFIFDAKARGSLHQYQMDLARQYGNTAIKLRWPQGYGVSITCPQLLEDIYRHTDRGTPERGASSAWVLYLESENKPKALLTSQEMDWERRRASVRGLMLKTDAMKSALAAMSSVSDDLCKVIEERKDSQDYVPDTVQVIYRWAFEGIINVLFGTRAGCLELGGNRNPKSDAFINGLNIILDAAFNSLAPFAHLHKFLNTRLWRQHKLAWDTVSDSVDCHTEEMLKSLSRISPDSTPMMMSLLGNNHLSNEEVQSMAMELLFGGVDTTSNAMSFLLHNLANNPEKQDKLRAEIRSVIGEEEITLDHIQRMTYLRNCIKESLRMYPILFINGRILKSDFVSERHGIHLKSETPIMFHNYAMGRLQSLWDRPDDFIPERFERKPGETQVDRSHLFSVPFGLGTRSCIGKRVAEAEISSLAIKIIKSYELSVDDRYPFIPVSRGVLTPGKYLPVRFHKLP